MKYRDLYTRQDEDESWRFEDEPESTILIGQTVGCMTCCTHYEPVNREMLLEHIRSLENRLSEALELLGRFG